MNQRKSKILLAILLLSAGLIIPKSESYANEPDSLTAESNENYEYDEIPDDAPEFIFDPMTVSFPAPVSLYEVKNYSPICDISQNAPNGTPVINAMSAAAITGAIDFAQETATQEYDITFNCQMHYTAPMWDSYTDMPQNADYYESFSFKATLNASVTYQYISSVPQIYVFENLGVHNRLFPANDYGDSAITYSIDDLNSPHIDALFRIHSLQAESGTENYVKLSQNMPLSDPYVYDYTPGDAGYHYSFYGTDNISVDVNVEGTRAGDWSGITEAVEQKLNDITANISAGTWSCNDYAAIKDDTKAFVLMSDEKVYGASISGTVDIIKNDITLDSINVGVNNDSAASSQYQYGGAGYTMDAINSSFLASRITGAQAVSIPDVSDISDAPTGIVVRYKNIFAVNGEHDITLTAGKCLFGDTADNIYDHVMSDGVLAWHNGGDPDDGYPIRIQMSESTIAIVDHLGHSVSEKTQLTPEKYNADADNQLLLDKKYYIRWNNYGCASLVWDTPTNIAIEKFDKYVSDKYIRFPFDVVYDNTIFYADETSGYTDWIQISRPDDWQVQWNSNEINPDKYESANHWQMTPFYIPCFAQEGGEPGADIYVEVKIVMSAEKPDEEEEEEDSDSASDEAIDADGSEENSNEDTGENGENQSDTETTVPEGNTKVQVQLSGWLYGLTIVGTNNELIYNGNGLLERKKGTGCQTYPMANEKKEIRSGVYNRLGTSNFRYLQDGSITNNCLEELTLPLRNGSSFAFPSMGAVWKGQKVAFIVKTMANLTGDADSVEVMPDIYFQTPDGEILSYKNGEIKICVTDAIGNLTGEEYDTSNWDISNGQRLSLSDPLLQGCYYDAEDANDIQYGNWIQTTMDKENLSRNIQGLNPLTIQQYLERKFPSYTLSHISVPSALRLFCGEYEQLEMNDGLMYDRQDNTAPLKDYRGWGNFSEGQTKDKVIYSMQQWQFEYSIPAHVKVIDVRDKGGSAFDLAEYICEQDDRWWWGSDPDVYINKGSLLIQFHISAFKDGEPYLRYSADEGQYLNMWEREGYCSEYPYGTVLVVDMSKSMNDYFLPAIQNIN